MRRLLQIPLGSMMLRSLAVKNFTMFQEARLRFSPKLNVIVGENGAGKTHLLKLAYSVVSSLTEEKRRPSQGLPNKGFLQQRIAEKIVNVFRPDALGRLARRRQGRERCDVSVEFRQSKMGVLSFSFATNSKTEVTVDDVPNAWLDASPVYLPTRELLSIFPNFVSVYESHLLEFEETWRDTCLLLGLPPKRGKTDATIRELTAPLEEAMRGTIELDRTGRFYLRTATGLIEIPLVAEGLRKFAMLARLIYSGALINDGYLFWDEPEANLNPRLIRQIAASIVGISRAGVQVFVATHSLFLLREIEIILTETPDGDVRYFGLSADDDDAVSVLQGESVADIGDIAALDEELAQSDRFLASVAE